MERRHPGNGIDVSPGEIIQCWRCVPPIGGGSAGGGKAKFRSVRVGQVVSGHDKAFSLFDQQHNCGGESTRLSVFANV